jgi:cell division protein FtsI/penicillin-binding protein 2
LAGKPGGTLRAGATTIASSSPRKAAAVKTTIDSQLQQAAVQQLGQRVGGIVVLKPSTGEILGYSGSPFSNLQPPGSTFKIITLSAALQNKIVDVDSTFPSVASVDIAGVPFENADRELCGGTLTEVFAKSCNTAFGPIGAKIGAKKLIDMAHQFGFDKPPTIEGAKTSTMPNEQTLDDDLQVASASIGQSTTQATTLQMATAAATIALKGRRPDLTLNYKDHGKPARTTKVIDPLVASQVKRMMLAVVNQGTGELAQIPGVQVAGKTGTAELQATQDCDPSQQKTTTTKTDGSTTISKPCPKPTSTDTDAWFTAFAPAGHPDIVVCVMLVGEGQGRETAAPAAKNILEVALGKKHLSDLLPPPAPSVDPNLQTQTTTTPTTTTPATGQ